jgi:hypothetical protein
MDSRDEKDGAEWLFLSTVLGWREDFGACPLKSFLQKGVGNQAGSWQ